MTRRIMGGFLLCFAKVKCGTVEGGDIGEGPNFERIKKNERGRKGEGIRRNGARRTLFCVN